jgi:addiction module HigA family antidote
MTGVSRVDGTARGARWCDISGETMRSTPGRGKGPMGGPCNLYHQMIHLYMITKKLAPLHPGEVLREEFLTPLNMSAGALARACGVPRTRIERLANEQTGVTADTALRLAKVFGTSPELWLNLQNDFDVQIAKREIGEELDKIDPVIAAKMARRNRR